MVTRLVADVLRRFAGVWTLGFVLLTIWRLGTAATAGPAPDVSAAERAGFLFVTTTLAMLLPILAGQAVASWALNKRAVQMLPVSRRDIWRARWMLTTLGAATLTMAAQALTMVISRATAPAASDAFAELVVTWSSTVILGGVLLALGLYIPRLLPATGVTPVVWFLRNLLAAYVWLLLAGVFIMGAIWLPGLLLRYVTMDWHGLSGWHGLATALALLVAIASYWHRPAVHTRPGRPPEAGAGCSGVTLMPRGTLSAIRLLVFENVVSASVTASVVLGVIAALMTARQSFGEAVDGIASWFGHQVAFTSAGGVPPFTSSPIFFGLLFGFATGFAHKLNTRHLRTLPVSTVQLTGLLLLPALLFWLAVIAIVSGVHLAVIGRLPRIDPSFPTLAIGITALSQPLGLQFRRRHLQLSALAALIPVAWVLMQRLPGVLAPRTHPIAFGLLLTAIAITWSYWLLTRSSTPFSASTMDA